MAHRTTIGDFALPTTEAEVKQFRFSKNPVPLTGFNFHFLEPSCHSRFDMISIVNPKKVEILLLEGTPFGLRYADIKNKVCRAFVAPRSSFKSLLSRQEMSKPGIYLLVDRGEDRQLPLVYIGEADVLSDRLRLHADREFWSEAVVFVSQDDTLDKAGVRYLESVLVSRAEQDKLCDLQNSTRPSVKNLSEANLAVMDEFVDDIVYLLSVLGYKLIRSQSQPGVTADQPLLYISGVGVKATGRDTDEGLIVYRGSTVRVEETRTIGTQLQRTRRKLLEKNVLVLQKTKPESYLFTQDYPFSSPSLAAGVILGRRSNGRTDWKTKTGKTLKEIQEAVVQ